MGFKDLFIKKNSENSEEKCGIDKIVLDALKSTNSTVKIKGNEYLIQNEKFNVLGNSLEIFANVIFVLTKRYDFFNDNGPITFFDIGTDFGVVPIHLYTSKQVKNVFVFEPWQKRVKYIKRNLKENIYKNDFVFFNFGLKNSSDTLSCENEILYYKGILDTLTPLFVKTENSIALRLGYGAHYLDIINSLIKNYLIKYVDYLIIDFNDGLNDEIISNLERMKYIVKISFDDTEKKSGLVFAKK